MKNKFYLQGELKLQKETIELKEKASEVIKLPEDKNKQPDLMYLSAILVSSGENLNHAYFLGSELLAAGSTITNKALDLEHHETSVVGHLYERVYTDKDNKVLDITELSARETASLDVQEMHIQVAGILYKNRFPELAKEIEEGEWPAVSMECYYEDYDIKIGDLTITRKEAELLGLASLDNSMLGKMAKVLKGGKEIAAGALTRVLRNISFFGCGIVKNPANPASVILETAANKDITHKESDEIIVLDYDNIEKLDEKSGVNNVTIVNTEDNVIKEEARDGMLDDTLGVCVNYKKRVYDKDEKIIAEDWCSLFEGSCTSFSRDTTDPDCLRNKAIREYAKAYAEAIMESNVVDDKREELLDELKAVLREAVKIGSRR